MVNTESSEGDNTLQFHCTNQRVILRDLPLHKKSSFFYFLFRFQAISYSLSELNVMLRLHYVPGGHGSHDFGHRGRNGVTVTQRRGTGSTNVARRGRRDHRDRFLNSQKICHGSHGAIDLLKCAVVERG